MVNPVELQWTSAGTDGFEQAARAIPGRAGRQIRSVAMVRRILALGQLDTTSRRGSGCYGKVDVGAEEDGRSGSLRWQEQTQG
jgi:hypothetical protein